MSQHYSDESRADDKWSLPDVEVFEMTAREIAERDDDLIYEYMKRHEFRLASMNSRTRDAMFDTMIEEQGIKGGWGYWYCFPGCMPDSDIFGPFATRAEAIEDMQENAE